MDRPPDPLRLAADLDGRRAAADPAAANGASDATPDPDPEAAGPDPAGPAGQPTVGLALSVRGVVVPGRLRVPELDVTAGEKLLITGPNGAGKTTLLDTVAGVRRPEYGTVRRRGRLGYLPQEQAPPSNPELRLLPAFAAGRAGDIGAHAAQLLLLGLFRSADFHIRVGSLSVGQYRRLALARLLTGHFDVLLFDEPTNHLAPLLVGELEDALSDFSGTLVLVSHDRALRQWFAGLAGGRQLAMADGALTGADRSHQEAPLP